MGLLEKQLERQFTLLYLLNTESSNVNELAKKLNITDKTLVADIEHFNDSCFPVHIGINHYKEVILSMPKNINLDDIFIKLLNNSINVKILKYIIISEPTLTEISNSLFLSKTSIRRIVTKINTYFFNKNIDIQIDLQTRLMIVGNETEIRRLFASMFKEMYQVKGFAYFDTIYQLLRRCLKTHNKTASTPKIIYSVYYIFISIIRIGNNHFVPEVELINKETVVNTILSVIQDDTVFTTLMNQKYKFHVNKNNVANILSSYFGLLFAEGEDSYELIPAKIEKFLTHFYYLLNIDMTISKRTVDYFFEYINFYKELMIFKVSYADIFYKKMMQSNPNVWQAYHHALKVSELNFIEKSELLHKDLLLELLISSSQLLRMIEPKVKEKSILVLSSQEMGVSLLYKNIILNKYPFFKNIDIYEKDVFAIDYRLVNQYDLILTDVSLNFERITSDVLKISKVPTPIFWSKFEACLYSS
ncbi:helix-turn-helix domain-containing protein [Enterococcus ratti]|uniref:Mga helix-turn-helix domain-containing protein n=1 Tax=Enterococcus ratti TaxID=150033 RepID=A0A1L8WRK2_9ENTE|nr:helix-turn-helix domain-containing protein [Enterococcus ratti]OJG83636.1 hypothetical protein RV14_GL000870 [Enterococcus ratti]